MPFVKATCTNCNGQLEVDPAKEAAICPYCGTAYIVEKAIKHYNTTNNIRADVVNVYGTKTTADDLFEKAQTYVQLEEMRNAGATLGKLMEEYPGDPRATKLFIELWLDTCIRQRCLRFSNEVGALNEALWKRAIKLNGNSIIQLAESKLAFMCKQMQTGAVFYEVQTIPQWFQVPSVAELVESISYTYVFNQEMDSLLKEKGLYVNAHPQTNMHMKVKNVHVCFNRWFFADDVYRGYDGVWFADRIIGQAFWYKKDGIYLARKFRYPFNLDFLNYAFKGLRDDLKAGVCPYCGKGKQKFLSKKCSNCAMEYENAIN